MIHQEKYVIKETHLDFMGHMNNASYLELFEEARWDFVVSNGYGIPEIRKFGVGPVILDCTIKFMRELCARDEITISTEFFEYTGKVGKLTQRMIKADGVVACEAVFTFGLFDTKNRKLIEPTAEWNQAMGLSKALPKS